jgi:hypothetical protein
MEADLASGAPAAAGMDQEQERTLALRLPGMLAPHAVLARCLHYLEEQGLIEPGRLGNG